MEDLSRPKHKPEVLPIVRVVDETPKIKTFYVRSPRVASESEPGQFVMLWVVGEDEIPIAVSEVRNEDIVGLTVEKVGDATSELHSLGVGDLIGIRGPYGRGFGLLGEKFLMIGGGCGMGPLFYAIQRAFDMKKDIEVLISAKTDSDLLFRSRVKDMDVDLMVSTEDGSAGIEGVTTDVLENSSLSWDYDSCLICGPERMMKLSAEFVRERGVPVQVSLNRYMKCGIGICGQCTIDPSGDRVCEEGPVFNYEDIRDSEFGEYRRGPSGKRKKL
ncbi:MAG: dihydroorotate dehydrogenase electron transfer subunit [Candidatus Hadarchaeia archaeon]